MPTGGAVAADQEPAMRLGEDEASASCSCPGAERQKGIAAGSFFLAVAEFQKLTEIDKKQTMNEISEM